MVDGRSHCNEDYEAPEGGLANLGTELNLDEGIRGGAGKCLCNSCSINHSAEEH